MIDWSSAIVIGVDGRERNQSPRELSIPELRELSAVNTPKTFAAYGEKPTHPGVWNPGPWHWNNPDYDDLSGPSGTQRRRWSNITGNFLDDAVAIRKKAIAELFRSAGSKGRPVTKALRRVMDRLSIHYK